jgi:GNAT superfamily N-acetyltransferase
MKASEKKEALLKIKEVTESDFEIFKSWFNTPFEVFQCFGPTINYPLQWQEVQAFLAKHPPRYFVTGWQNEKCIALGKIIPPANNAPPRLGWIAVNKEVRGQGLGVQWLAQLCAISDEKYPRFPLQLYVLEGNPAAKSVYLKNGFKTLPKSENIQVQFEGAEIVIEKMERNEFNRV